MKRIISLTMAVLCMLSFFAACKKKPTAPSGPTVVDTNLDEQKDEPIEEEDFTFVFTTQPTTPGTNPPATQATTPARSQNPEEQTESVTEESHTLYINDNYYFATYADRSEMIQYVGSHNRIYTPPKLHDQFISTIRSTAFAGNTNLEVVYIYTSPTVLEDGAFAGCTALTHVALPPSLKTIGDNIFEGCTSLVKIYLKKDSYAYTWAKEHGYESLVEFY